MYVCINPYSSLDFTPSSDIAKQHYTVQELNVFINNFKIL